MAIVTDIVTPSIPFTLLSVIFLDKKEFHLITRYSTFKNFFWSRTHGNNEVGTRNYFASRTNGHVHRFWFWTMFKIWSYFNPLCLQWNNFKSVMLYFVIISGGFHIQLPVLEYQHKNCVKNKRDFITIFLHNNITKR